MSTQYVLFLYHWLFPKVEELPLYDLEERTHFFPEWLIYVVLFGLGFLSIVKLIYPDGYKVLFETFFRTANKIDFNDNVQLLYRSSRWLIFHFAISSSVLLYMMIIYYDYHLSGYFAFFPFAYFLYALLAMEFVGWATGQAKSLREQKQIIVHTYIILGLIYVPLVLIWLIRVDLAEGIFNGAVLLTLIIFIYRIFKGLRCAIQNNVSWYYLILYFCTLELWPLLVLYRLA